MIPGKGEKHQGFSLRQVPADAAMPSRAAFYLTTRRFGTRAWLVGGTTRTTRRYSIAMGRTEEDGTFRLLQVGRSPDLIPFPARRQVGKGL